MRTRRRASALVTTTLAVACLAAATPAAVSAAAASTPEETAQIAPYFNVIAHRGATGETITENTVPAFAAALAQGADAIEFDVRRTSDGRGVVLHDATLNRTTTCRGWVSHRTLGHIKRRCRGIRGGEPIVGLNRVLDWAVGNELGLMLELKHSPKNPWTESDVATMLAAAETRGLLARTVVLSFSAPVLRLVERVAPAVRTQAIARTADQIPVLAAEFDGVNVRAFDLDTDTVLALQGQGALLLARITNDPLAWAHLRDLGVTGLLTDAVPDYLLWADQVGADQ